MRILPEFFIFNLCEFSYLVHSMAAGAATSATEGASSSSLGAGKGQEGLSFTLFLLLVPCTVQLQKRVGLLHHHPKKLCLEYCKQNFFGGKFASFWLWELRSSWVVQA